jgi:ATP-dependent helicase YprA (DUF1998 family)
MSIFTLRDSVIDTYHDYVRSFLNIRDERLRQYVAEQLERGELWPDPLLQVNPAYQMGATVQDLVAEGLLHPECARIFRGRDGGPLRLYAHQEQAIRAAGTGQPYVVTSGTGSGKSLTYLIPIVDALLRDRPERRSVRAIIIYPMNALVNSQEEMLHRLREQYGGHFPVRYARYTGEVGLEERSRLQAEPPHILLTNYVMLELMLLRPEEHVFVDRLRADLRFVVLDELHTYSGRRGADVAMLLRRLRERCGGERLQFVGTSATMVAGGQPTEQRRAVARVASRLFGRPVPEQHVIAETLVRATETPVPADSEALRAALAMPLPDTWDAFRQHPLAAWVEHTLGVEQVDGALRRRTPRTLAEVAAELARSTGYDVGDCQTALRAFMERSSTLVRPDGTPALAFKLHQFVAQGGSVHATLQPPDQRVLTMSGQVYTRTGSGAQELRLYPLSFCRECGQEFYRVRCEKAPDGMGELLRAWPPAARLLPESEEAPPGYLVLETPEQDAEPLWPEDAIELLPPEWLEADPSGRLRVRRAYRRYLPQARYVTPDGLASPEPRAGAMPAWLLAAPLRLCPRCKVTFTGREGDYRKLLQLSSEGRSTATTLLAAAAITHLRQGAGPMAPKLLSFTDNRQDASLQAGHFNDFVHTVQLRAALYAALRQAPDGALAYHEVAARTAAALGLDVDAYSRQPVTFGPARHAIQTVFEQLIEYRLYTDLRRAWRVQQPNLEQCGLLRIEYAGLDTLCADDAYWQTPAPFRALKPADRAVVVRVLLDYLRRALAVEAPCLDPTRQERLRREVRDKINDEWGLEEDEYMEPARRFVTGPVRYERRLSGDAPLVSLGRRSLFGQWLVYRSPLAPVLRGCSGEEYTAFLTELVTRLAEANLLLLHQEHGDLRGRLRSSALVWRLGDGTPPVDPVRVRRNPAVQRQVQEANRFFTYLYANLGQRMAGLLAREHTGQISREHRQERERQFREGALPVLFCSPTMELGIDIADLSLVHLRNVPPTPANYAQRSGRAGRSGQPALVATSCSPFSPHDQYFFRRREQMVAGVVAPPRFDLLNEDLLEAHIHALWLAETGISLPSSLANLLEMELEGYPLREDVRLQLTLSPARLARCAAHCRAVLADLMPDLQQREWYSDAWVEQVLADAGQAFDRALDRWRELYREATEQLRRANRDIEIHLRTRGAHQQQREAQRLRDEAERQLALLNNQEGGDDSDFYPYRYLATEGFLPGYNFARLPVRAFIPTQPTGDFIVRPRFLALSEFGPHNLIYHEGRKFRVARVRLQPGKEEQRFVRAKLCRECGWLHEGEALAADRCQHCDVDLAPQTCYDLPDLFELTTVVCQARERITCDEEERIRHGYQIETFFRFPDDPAGTRVRRAVARDADGRPVLELAYSAATTLWNVNLGWRVRPGDGFLLDLSTGQWRGEPDADDTAAAPASQAAATLRRVRLFVRDTRNTLFVRLPAPQDDAPSGPSAAAPEEVLAGLQHALVEAMKTELQLEEEDLASARIGADAHRRLMLWEAAEGGIGALEQLVTDPDLLPRIARRALELCHYDPDTGAERQDTPEPCVAACYACLLSYTNQPDHELLRRQAIRDLLLALARAHVEPLQAGRTYEQQYRWLCTQLDQRSPLERAFLDYLYQHRLRLPDEAQYYLPDAYARPDFYYRTGNVCIFCDGGVHALAQVRERDDRAREALRDLGYRVVVVREGELAAQVAQYADVFGREER